MEGTRLLGKPKSFDSASDNWRQYKCTFLGYAGAVVRLKQAVLESEMLTEPAISNAALPPRDQPVSTQPHHVLVGLLGEGLLSWRSDSW